MNSVTRTLQAPIRAYFREMAALIGQHQHLTGALEDTRTQKGKRLAAHPGKGFVTGASILLIVSDLTDDSGSNWRVPYPVGAHSAFDQQSVLVLDALLTKVNQLAVAQSFELFETFLRNTVAAQLSLAPQESGTDFARAMAAHAPRRDIRYYRRVARKIARPRQMGMNEALLRWLRGRIKLGELEGHNNRGVNLRVWFRVWSQIRHSAVHNNGVLKPSIRSTFSPTQLKYQRHFFPTTRSDRVTTLNLSRSNVEGSVTLATEYAFGLFKAQAIRFGADWKDVLKRPGPK